MLEVCDLTIATGRARARLAAQLPHRARRAGRPHRRVGIGQVPHLPRRHGPPARLAHRVGRVTVGGDDRNLVGLAEADAAKLRGANMAMVFQEPMTALNPLMRVGRQIAESMLIHRTRPNRAAAERRARRAARRMSASRRRRRRRARTRTSSPVGSDSASSSRSRSPTTPSCWSATSRRPRSTSPSRRRSSTWCCRRCRVARPVSSSSRTTWPSSARRASASS